jgi:hypothetical protein
MRFSAPTSLSRIQPWIFLCVLTAGFLVSGIVPTRSNAQTTTSAGSPLPAQETRPTIIEPKTTDGNVVLWSADDPDQDGRWEFKDPAGWKFTETDGQRVLSQFLKSSDYRPPHRSPLHIGLLKTPTVTDFQMDAWVKSTHPEYGHRDVCLFFGYAAPDQFYYLHMASEMDDHANQIFLVNQADRSKISSRTTAGTRWDDQWHHVRLIRNVTSGEIAVFFDDMNEPVMTAVDKTIGSGQLGVGSFDDTVDVKRIEIRAR